VLIAFESIVASSPALLLLGLAMLTLLHEDVAIVAGAGLISAGTLPLAVVAAALLGGIVAGDVLFYTTGALTRRIAWLRRKVEGPAFQRCRDGLSRNLLGALVSCRIIPGIMMPTYMACGALGISFTRFALITISTASLYTLALLVFMTSSLAAPAVEMQVAGGLLVAGFIALRTRTGRAAVAALVGRVGLRQGDARTPAVELPGMPAIPAGASHIGIQERIPPLLFYIPLVLQWFWLGLRHRSLTLPTVANPAIEAGGLLGESKIRCLDQIGGDARRWVARSVAAVHDGSWTAAGLAAFAEAEGVCFPLVVKPDIGWRGFGVRRVASPADLVDYLAAYPRGSRFILQTYVPYDGEAGIFYVRRPGETRGFIFSMTLRYHPHVVGDGCSTLDELIAANPRAAWKAGLHREAQKDRLNTVPAAGEVVRLSIVGSSRVGGLYKDGRPFATPELARRFDAIADAMPHFHFGRFDVRFASIERLQAGEDFQIVEVNGAGAEAIHVWDPDVPLGAVYADLFEQQALMFEVGASNRARGFRPLSLRELVGYQRRQQKLLGVYPASN